MSTTNVEPHDNQVKGIVVVGVNLGRGIEVTGSTQFTTDRLEEVGIQGIGTVQSTHNIIDDNGNGYRIVQEGNHRRVEKIEKTQVSELIKLLNDSKKKTGVPIKQSDIDLINAAGYEIVIKDKSLIIDDEQER